MFLFVEKWFAPRFQVNRIDLFIYKIQNTCPYAKHKQNMNK